MDSKTMHTSHQQALFDPGFQNDESTLLHYLCYSNKQ